MGEAASSPNFNYGYPSPGPQDPTAQKVMDHVFFLSEGEWKYVRENQRFDFIVVGTGFCALAFAERTLKHNPKARILMLERGPFFLPDHFQNLPLPYQQTLGGLSETFPWTLSARTAGQPAGTIGWQHGMVPFFGGRSILWSAWCPRPRLDEMRDWSKDVVEAAERNFPEAEKLLNVVPADRIDSELDPATLATAAKRRPIYSVLQRRLQEMVADGLKRIPSATRSMPAPIAVGAGIQEDIDFAKFSTPAPLLGLVHGETADSPVKRRVCIATECTVQRILQQDGVATALETSRGVVNVGEAKLILAMGSLPPATLLLNSFPTAAEVGSRFTAHFISSIVARVPRNDFPFEKELANMELAAIYVAGKAKNGMQYHVQLSALADRDPKANAQRAARYAPDVVATASPQQLATSKDYVVFVCAVLGELDERNGENWLRRNGLSDPTTNVTLQVLANSVDVGTWDTMDEGTFQLVEQVLSPKGAGAVEYWHGFSDTGAWKKARPEIAERRVPGLVHEGSTLWIDADPDKGPVGRDYRPKGVKNVYVTGGGLWPTSGSWNPTLTMVALAQDLADRLAGSTSTVAAQALPTPIELSSPGERDGPHPDGLGSRLR
jgi:choline dehydrogenase-like flavoprotein